MTRGRRREGETGVLSWVVRVARALGVPDRCWIDLQANDDTLTARLALSE